MNMKLYTAALLTSTAAALSLTSGYMSVRGMVGLFPAQALVIGVMMTGLEAAKVVASTWLHNAWSRDVVSGAMKSYLAAAVIVLMILTSMGIYGFLAAARSTSLERLNYAGHVLGLHDVDGVVQIVIMALIFVFDPLALTLMIAGSVTYGEHAAAQAKLRRKKYSRTLSFT